MPASFLSVRCTSFLKLDESFVLNCNDKQIQCIDKMSYRVDFELTDENTNKCYIISLTEI